MNKSLALALVLSPLAVACGKPYTVVKYAAPNPFTRPGCSVAVEGMHYERLMVGDKPVADYAGEKRDSSRESFDQDLRDSNGRFAEAVKVRLPSAFVPPSDPSNSFVLRPTMTQWEPGFYAYVASRPSMMNIVVDVLDQGGNVLDEILVRGSEGAGFEGSGTRMRSLAEKLGLATSRYLQDRWVCAPR